MRTIIICILTLTISCVKQPAWEPTSERTTSTTSPTKNKTTPPAFLKPTDILENKNKFHDKKVKVLAYYIPHHDGDWITPIKGSYSHSTINVPNTGKTRIKLKNGKVAEHPSQLNWGNNGIPVIIEGRYIKNGVTHHMGLKMKNKSMIYRDRIIEIDTNNPEWRKLYK